MISPKNNPGVGVRWGAGERSTPREYNAGDLIYQPPQRRAQIVRLKAERARLGLVGDMALGVYQVETIGPSRVGLLGRIAELIDHRGNLDTEFSYTRSRHQGALLFIFGTGKNYFVFDIALHLPDIARMRFRDIHHQERNLVSVLVVELVESGNLPPEGRSCVAAKDEHYRLPLRGQGGELHRSALVELHQREVRGTIANLEGAGASLRPQGFEWKEEKWDGPRQFSHEARECFWRLAHDLVERGAAKQP